MSARNARRSAAAVALLVLGTAGAAAAQTATQVVNFSVSAVNVISFAGSPTLTVISATAGGNPSVTNSTATWAVTTNQTTAKITGALSAAMPAGLTLSVNLTAPTGATSAGLQVLPSTGSVDLVTAVTKVAQGSLGVSYTLDAAPTAGVVASGSRTVTYTITGGT